MLGKYITGQLQRTNRNLLRNNLLLLIAVLGSAAIFNRYLQNFFFGPFPYRKVVSAKGDVSIPWKNYVRIAGDKSFDTGMNEITRKTDKYSDQVVSETLSARFVLLKTQDKVLLVKSDGDGNAQTEYTGALVPIPEKVYDRLFIASSPEESAAFQSGLLPYMLDTSNFRTSGYIGMAIAVPLLLFACWNLRLYSRRLQNPKTHPIMNELAWYGDATMVTWELDTEMQGSVYSHGSCLFTSNWLVQEEKYGLRLLRLEDLVWAYKEETQHRTNGIPTRKTYAIVLKDSNGRGMVIPCLEKQVTDLLQRLAARTPWMLFGYDADLAKLWNADRAGFIQQINQRR